MEAADESKREHGAPVTIESVTNKAKAGKPSADSKEKEIEQLIEQLVEVSEPGFGYSAYFSGFEFLPYKGTGEMSTLVLGAARSRRSPVLRNIVEKGVDAVPALVKHLGDARTIKMKPVRGMMWVEYKDEYDYNHRTGLAAPEGVNSGEQRGDGNEAHAVTVGDLCFVALGQIVNRRFSATRYQPSGGLVVNSPTDSEALRQAVVRDWSRLTKQVHRDMLIADFVTPDHEDRRIGAYRRLAYYYPDAVEPLVLKQLAEPRYDVFAVEAFARQKLYRVADAKERKGLFDAFVAKHGEPARQGLLLQLFEDLDMQEADEQGRRSPPLKEKRDARNCLIELYGYHKTVGSGDRPKILPLEDAMQARFIGR